jgi:acyl-CoA thioesterase-1
MENIGKIDIFGDSVMKGVVLEPESDRYCALPDDNLRSLEERFNVVITNRSKFGCTCAKGKLLLSRFMAKGLDCDWVLLEYGGNDCNFRWEEVAAAPDKEHYPVTDYTEFIKTNEEMVEALKKAGIRPVLMTLPPVDAEKYLNYLSRQGLNTDNVLRWLGDAQMIYRYQEMYSNGIVKLAAKLGTKLLDVRRYFLDKRIFKSLLCRDGLHPNREGHALIYKALGDFMSENKVNGRSAVA